MCTRKSLCNSIWVTALLALVLAATHANAIYCQKAVTIMVTPCEDYLTGKASTPPKQCCPAADSLNGLVKTKPDRINLCECLKLAIPYLGIKPDRAKGLPNVCKIKFPVPFDPKADCKSI